MHVHMCKVANRLQTNVWYIGYLNIFWGNLETGKKIEMKYVARRHLNVYNMQEINRKTNIDV